MKCQAGWITSWSQDFQEKYHQPQICRRYHSNCRKWRGTKELLDEYERGEWKSWLKTQNSKNEDHGIWSHHFMANRWGNSENSDRLYFWGAPKSLQMVTIAMKLKDAYSLEEKLWQPRWYIKKQRHYFANKDPSSQGYGFFQWSYMDVRVGL